MVEEAETRSRKLLADAAIEARRSTEAERRRLEQEINELQSRRDAVEHRRRRARELRVRLPHASGQCDRVRPPRDRARPAGDQRSRRGRARREARAHRRRPRGCRRPVGDDGGRRPQLHGCSGRDRRGRERGGSRARRRGRFRERGRSTCRGAARGARTSTIDLFGEEQAANESAALDDDSFFASLRDAVRDDAPLGPRDAYRARLLRSGRLEGSGFVPRHVQASPLDPSGVDRRVAEITPARRRSRPARRR